MVIAPLGLLCAEFHVTFVADTAFAQCVIQCGDGCLPAVMSPAGQMAIVIANGFLNNAGGNGFVD